MGKLMGELSMKFKCLLPMLILFFASMLPQISQASSECRNEVEKDFAKVIALNLGSLRSEDIELKEDTTVWTSISNLYSEKKYVVYRGDYKKYSGTVSSLNIDEKHCYFYALPGENCKILRASSCARKSGWTGLD